MVCVCAYKVNVCHINYTESQVPYKRYVYENVLYNVYLAGR